jgi:predicted RNA binding protein YcfA (HicA-like mRNA interferase family)
MNGNEVIAQLKATGWILDCINGGHPIMVKNGVAVPVPVHGRRAILARAYWPPSSGRPALN